MYLAFHMWLSKFQQLALDLCNSHTSPIPLTYLILVFPLIFFLWNLFQRFSVYALRNIGVPETELSGPAAKMEYWHSFPDLLEGKYY